MSEIPDKCYMCDGEIEAEIVGKYRDWVCQDCGIILDSEMVVEDQQHVEIEGDFEVME